MDDRSCNFADEVSDEASWGLETVLACSFRLCLTALNCKGCTMDSVPNVDVQL